jgi:adenine-specific DNA-methyltransferase
LPPHFARIAETIAKNGLAVRVASYSAGVSIASSHAPERRKALGAFYTPPAMAQVLVDWAVRDPADHVFDPAFGGAVFFHAAKKRLRALGASEEAAGRALHGFEFDIDAHAAALGDASLGAPADQLVAGSFFEMAPPTPLPRCEAVVGNPPYVRYGVFNRWSEKAHAIAAEAGARLTHLASSWAPFVIHAVDYVAPGGRMAQVLPAELLHAQYGETVLDFLCREFADVTLAVFQDRVFPGALEEVVLLFADGRGAGQASSVRLIESRRLADFSAAQLAPSTQEETNSARGSGRLLSQLLHVDARDLYSRLEADERVHTLGALASVDIGAVTGGNDFFLLSDEHRRAVARELQRATVSKAVHIAGARFAAEHLTALDERGARMWLFVAEGETEKALLQTAQEYLTVGEDLGVADRYKCRVRNPWWAVPLPKAGVADIFLTYCSNVHPRMVLNEAKALNTNTVHGVTVNAPETAAALAVGFYNSLTLLSAELVGRSYGGGVLKLEPTEAERLLIPPIEPALASQLTDIDELLRAGNVESVVERVDPVVLGDGLGLTGDEIEALRTATAQLRARRRARGKPPAGAR